MSPIAYAPIPVTILTGFLGAGKTTLLNRMLHGDHGLRVAVLVNDFGEINIDSQLVVATPEEEVINLANGCICCSIRGDLIEALHKQVNHPSAPEYLVIETSGVSNPGEVAQTIMLPQLASRIRLDSIVAIVDSEQFTELDDQNWYVAGSQVSVADMIVFNKVDLVDESQLIRLRGLVRDEFLSKAPIFETTYAQVPLELLLNVGRYDMERLVNREPLEVHVHRRHGHGDADHDHDPDDHTLAYDTWRFSTDGLLAYNALREAVDNLPPTVFRAKGVLCLDHARDRQAILQVVGKRARIDLGSGWHDRPPRSHLVVIGAAGSLDAAWLQHHFEACLAKKRSLWPRPIQKTVEWARRLWT